MLLRQTTCLLAFSAALASALPASPTEIPVPISAPTINYVTSTGNGCPNGTVTYILTPINSTLGTYALTHFLRAATSWQHEAKNTSAKRFSKTCSLNTSIKLPSGWYYRMDGGGLDVSGYVWLPDAMRKMSLNFSYFWPNDSGTTSSSRFVFPGPHTGRFSGHTAAQYPGVKSAGSETPIQIAFRVGVGSDVDEWPQNRPEVTPEEQGWVLTHIVEVLEYKRYWEDRSLATKHIRESPPSAIQLSYDSDSALQAAPAPTSTSISQPPIPTLGTFLAHGGNGCPEGTVTQTLTPTNISGTFILTHTLTSATLWPNTSSPPLTNRNVCVFAPQILLPKRYRYRLNRVGVSVAGYVWLPDAQRSMSVQVTYVWPTDGSTPTSKLFVPGPHGGRFALHAASDGKRATLSACGGDYGVHLTFQSRLVGEVGASPWPAYDGPEVPAEEQVWSLGHGVEVVEDEWCGNLNAKSCVIG